jgi:hypothetical protein
VKQRDEILQHQEQHKDGKKAGRQRVTSKPPLERSGDKTLERNDEFKEPAEVGAL